MSDERNHETNDGDRVSRLSATPPVEVVDDDPVVREYTQRYAGGARKRKVSDMPRSYGTLHVTDDEKLWASVAHASVWFTFIAGFLTAGFSVPVSIFVPLVIYFMFRKKSDYVTFHALQSFVVQIMGTVGALALLVVGGALWVVGLVIAAILMVVLVGFVLLPVWGLVGILLLLAVTAMPFVMVFLGTVGAIKTYNGQDYRYPYIARWVDRQLAGGFLNIL